MKTCVIGDIHGCLTPLQLLLEQVAGRYDTLVFLGDYVDRGPKSKQVIQHILAVKKSHPRTITLMGNHEYLFLRYLHGQDDGLFLQAGGKQTLASYGIPALPGTEPNPAPIPADHLAFLRSLPLFWEDEHAIYVHAGLQPGVHLSLQKQQWCLWARDQFLGAACSFGKPVVFGHTVFDSPHVAPDKIGIDTGAVYGGRLTALILPDMEFISVPGETPARRNCAYGI